MTVERPPQDPAALLHRRQRILASLDLELGRGLEIGPLYQPVALKEECDVRYVDVHRTPGLREYYAAHPGTPVDEIVEVDFPLVVGDRTRSLAEATAVAGPFDWVVASHVIEHVPDLIGWLADIADVLVDGGRLSLAIPDRRYSFDARRPATTVGQMLLAHHHGDTRPSVRAVFDHHHEAVTVDARAAWDGRPGRETTMFPLETAHHMAVRAMTEDTYMDCHVWLFTPRSLVRQLQVLARMGYLDFTVAHVDPTAVDTLEFFAVLERMPRDLDPAERARLVEEGFALPIDHVRPEPEPDPRFVTSEITHREQALLDTKRRISNRLKGLLSRR